jgi:hypothetical protein
LPILGVSFCLEYLCCVKRLFLSLVGILLVLGVSAGSVGVPFLIHTCNFSGKKNIQSNFFNCCGKKEKPPMPNGISARKCCSFEPQYSRIIASGTAGKAKVLRTLNNFVHFHSGVRPPISQTILKLSACKAYKTCGRQFLHSIHILRV